MKVIYYAHVCPAENIIIIIISAFLYTTIQNVRYINLQGLIDMKNVTSMSCNMSHIKDLITIKSSFKNWLKFKLPATCLK